jgi:hypothetical protein
MTKNTTLVSARSPYGLRGRPSRAGSVVRASSPGESSVSQPPASPTILVPTPRRYSDVVAARPTSAPPDLEGTNKPVSPTAEKREPAEKRESAAKRVTAEKRAYSAVETELISSDGPRESSKVIEHDDGEGPWIPIGRDGRPHVCSATPSNSSSSGDDPTDIRREPAHMSEFSDNQLLMINSAVASLSQEQMNEYNHHLKQLKLRTKTSKGDSERVNRPQTSFPIPGPSKHKGKTADWTDREIPGVNQVNLHYK